MQVVPRAFNCCLVWSRLSSRIPDGANPTGEPLFHGVYRTVVSLILLGMKGIVMEKEIVTTRCCASYLLLIPERQRIAFISNEAATNTTCYHAVKFHCWYQVLV